MPGVYSVSTCGKEWTEEELLEEQMKLEKLGHKEGTKRALDSYDRMIKYGIGSDTYVGKSTTQTLIPPILKPFKEAVEELKESRNNRKYKKFLPLLEDNTDVVAVITLRQLMNGAMGEKTWTTTLSSIGREVVNEAGLRLLRESDKQTYVKALDYIKLHHEHYRKEKVIRDLSAARNLKGKHSTNLNKFDRVLLGTWCAHTVLGLLTDKQGAFIEIVRIQDAHSVKCNTPNYLKFSKRAMEKIEELKDCLANMSHVVYPMVYPPIPVKMGQIENYGYLTKYAPKTRLVKTFNKSHREALKGAKYPVVVEGVNAAMSMRWKVNPKILELANELKQGDRCYGGLPRSTLEQDSIVKPVNTEGVTDPASLKQWKMRKTAAAERDKRLHSARAVFNLTLQIAEKMKKYPCFYNVWELDKRGRGYSSSALNSQKDDFTRALILNYKGKKLGKHGFYWLTQHLVNLIDEDPLTGKKISKFSLEDRYQWAMDNVDILLKLGSEYSHTTHWDDDGYIGLTDKPWQFVACLIEWCDIYHTGDKENYKSYISVSRDATCSGLQLLAAGFRCQDTAKLVNLVPNQEPYDVYSLIAMKLKKQIEDMAIDMNIHSFEDALAIRTVLVKRYCEEQGLNYPEQLNVIAKREDDLNAEIDRELYRLWATPITVWSCLQIDINRKLVKRSVMTFVYSSRQYGFSEQLVSDYFIQEYKQVSERLRTEQGIHLNTLSLKERVDGCIGFPFEGRGINEANLLAKLLYPLIQETLPIPSQAMDWMMDCADRISKTNAFVTWNTPLGLPIVQNYRKYKDRRIECKFSNKRFQTTIRDDIAECDVNKSKQGISPNVVHSLDASLLWLVVSNAKKIGITAITLVHDSFGTHAGNIDRFNRIIRESFVELFKDDVFSRLKHHFDSQMEASDREEVMMKPSNGNYDIEAILEAIYAFS